MYIKHGKKNLCNTTTRTTRTPVVFGIIFTVPADLKTCEGRQFSVRPGPTFFSEARSKYLYGKKKTQTRPENNARLLKSQVRFSSKHFVINQVRFGPRTFFFLYPDRTCSGRTQSIFYKYSKLLFLFHPGV